jgi:hypothetical protein
MSTRLNRRAILAGAAACNHGHLRPFRGPAPAIFSSLKRIRWGGRTSPFHRVPSNGVANWVARKPLQFL